MPQGSSYQRTAKLVPWYHQAKHECVAITMAGEQCINSAIYEVIGKPIYLCKTHADMIMADPDNDDHAKVRLIVAGKVWLR